MKVALKGIIGALNKIKILTSNDRTIPGIMLDVSDNIMKVCYSDGRKAFIEEIEVETSDIDVKGKVILDYARFTSAITACQPSGKLVVDNIDINITSDNKLVLVAEKKVPVGISEDGEVEYNVCSVFEQSLVWQPAGNDIKTSILTRVDYDSLFSSEVVDEYDIKMFKRMFTVLSSEKGRVVYISPKRKGSFVSNLAYLGYIDIDNDIQNPLSIKSDVAKQVADIVDKFNGDKLYLHIQGNKYICIYSEDKKVGLMVEMSEPSQLHLNTLNRYQTSEYKKYQLTFITDALKNVVYNAMAIDKVDKTVLKIKDNTLVIQSGNSNKNNYKVICSECIDNVGDIDKLELQVSLNVLNDILSNCDGEYVAIDIDVDSDDGKLIRVGDISIEKRNEVLDGVEYSSLSVADKLGIREKYLTKKLYTLSSK